jgi:hypothetical protein
MYSFIDGCKYFGITYFLHVRIEMEAEISPKTFVNIYKTE